MLHPEVPVEPGYAAFESVNPGNDSGGRGIDAGADGGPTLWASRQSRPLPPKSAVLRETGRLHVFRHTYCSRLAGAWVPVKTVRELAGHTTLNVTMSNAPSPSAKDEGMAMLERSRAEGALPWSVPTWCQPLQESDDPA